MQILTKIVSSTRCGWCGDDPLYVDCHDSLSGRPVASSLSLNVSCFVIGIVEFQQSGGYTRDPQKIKMRLTAKDT
ncbi:MAG: hypothetical protein CSA50_05150 [Gammaproteobacteria bacterium]|nr:MAG: hypothetical protein CSA50_05150 [Gammaproteobacteria bacterium]